MIGPPGCFGCYGWLCSVLECYGMLWKKFWLLWNVMYCYGCFGMLCNVRECFGLFWNVRECYGIFWNVMECCGMFWNVMVVLEGYGVL